MAAPQPTTKPTTTSATRPTDPSHAQPTAAAPRVPFVDVALGDFVQIECEVVRLFPETETFEVQRVGAPKLGMTAKSPLHGTVRFGILATDVLVVTPQAQVQPRQQDAPRDE